MHIVAHEQALAHWEALNGLPLATLNALRTRFLSAQPYLAFMALPKEAATSEPDAALSALEDLDNPAMSDFWRIATSAAMVSEILCREAGRLLRQLNADEVGLCSPKI